MNDDMNNNRLKEEAFLAKEITFYRLDNNANKFQVSGINDGWVQNEDRRPKNEDPFKIVLKSL